MSGVTPGIFAINPSIWGAASLIQSGHDSTATTMFPSNYQNNTAHYVQHNQASPTADSSIDLATITGFTGANRFTGCKYGCWLVCRSTAGATITAEFYIDGVASGVSATFSQTIHSVIELGELFYTLGDFFAGNTLTLRLSGGNATATHIVLVPRQWQWDASTIVDGTDGATTASDPKGQWGTVAKFPYSTTSGTANKKFLSVTAPGDAPAAYYGLIKLFAPGTYVGSPVAAASDYTTTFLNDVSPYRAKSYLNGTLLQDQNRNEGWLGWNHSFSGNSVVSPISSYDTNDTTFVSQGGSRDLLGAVAAGDTIEVRLGSQNSFNPIWYTSRLLVGRTLDDPDITSSPGSSGPYATGDTFSLSFSHPSSSYVDHFEGVVYDALGNVVDDQGAITSPWTVNVPDGAGTGAHAAILAVYDDDSYGFDYFDFDQIASSPQVWRYR